MSKLNKNDSNNITKDRFNLLGSLFSNQKTKTALNNLVCDHLSYMWRDDTNSKEEALSLGSSNAGAEQSPVLADEDAELPLQLRPASWYAGVIHLALSADLN